MYPCWIHRCVDDVFLLNIAICNGMASNYQGFFLFTRCGFQPVASSESSVVPTRSGVGFQELKPMNLENCMSLGNQKYFNVFLSSFRDLVMKNTRK